MFQYLFFVFIEVFTYFQSLYFYIVKYFKPKEPFFNVQKVITFNNDGSKNNTDIYLTKKNWKDLIVFNKCCITWALNSIQYINYYKNTELNMFPPYSFEDIRSPNKNEKIMVALLIDNIDKNKPMMNITNIIKQYAGPKENFYNDIDNYEVNTEDIFGTCKKTLQIITSKKTYNFDLQKNNIIQL